MEKALSMEPCFDLSSMSEKERMEMQCSWYNQTEGNLSEFDCPECKNRGYIAVAHYDEMFGTWNEVHRPCKCMEMRRLIRRLRQSGLPASSAAYEFGTFEASEPWQKAMLSKALDFKGGWFYVGGQSGCGKTHICTAILRRMMEEGRSGRYMLWRDEAVKLKSAVTDGYAGQMDEWKNADVLYIDDLFKTGKSGDLQRPTPADVNLAFELLNFRAVGRKTTIISSECTLNELIDIDEAIGGRVAELAKGFCLSIRREKSRNYRLKGMTEL